MRTAILTKDLAWWIMCLDLGTTTKERLEHYVRPGMPALTHLGSKLCVTHSKSGKARYRLDSYVTDGSDVTVILKEALELKMRTELRAVRFVDTKRE